MCVTDAELYDQNGALIRAAEQWSGEYKKDTATFGKLLKTEAKIERVFYGYLVDLAERAPGYVDWDAYNEELEKVEAAAKSLQLIMSDEEVDYEDSLVMKLMTDPIEAAVELGVKAGIKIYDKPIGKSAITRAVDEAAKKEIAFLVGKRVNKDGKIVDNPNAAYSVTQTTREDIRQAIRTSLSLGEDQAAATERIQEIIRDADRAAKIASTESVNAYQGGLYNFGKESGAVAKEWQTLDGACEICDGNAAEGPVPIGELFQSGDESPSAHPYDRCGVRYVYQEELDAAGQ